MLKKLILIAAGFAQAFALNSVEININDKDLELGATVDMSQMNHTIEPDTVFIGFKLLHADAANSDYSSSSDMEDFYEVSFLMKRDFSDVLQIGLGMKLNGTKNFATVPLGGEISYLLDTKMPMYVGGSLYYAPSVLALRDAKNFMEYRLTLDVEVIEGGMVTAGYRSINTNYETPSQDIKYNSSFYVGFKFKF